MHLSHPILFPIFYALLGINLVAFFFLVIFYFYSRHRKVKIDRIANCIINGFGTLNQSQVRTYIQKNFQMVMLQYIRIRQSSFQIESISEKIRDYLFNTAQYARLMRQLQSVFPYHRIKAAALLSYFSSKEAVIAIENAFIKEKKYYIKQYLANALTDINDEQCIPLLVNSLIHAPLWYRKTIWVLLRSFNEKFQAYLPQIIHSENQDIQELIVQFSFHYRSSELLRFLKNLIATQSGLAVTAVQAIRAQYPYELLDEQYLHHSNPNIQNEVILALSTQHDKQVLDRLIHMRDQVSSEEILVQAVSTILIEAPQFVLYVFDLFFQEKELRKRSFLAQALSVKIDYFLANILQEDKRGPTHLLISELLLLNQTAAIISFLNQNHTIEIENEILIPIKKDMPFNQLLQKELSAYLKKEILVKLALTPQAPEAQKRLLLNEEGKFWFLVKWLVIILFLFPVIYGIRHHHRLLQEPLLSHLSQYVVDYNFYMIFYSGSINLIYLILLVISIVGGFYQKKYWRIKSFISLFKKEMLPSISVLAPAYNEQNNIIESVNSLLNLQYPNYELIVINDGSTDQTLQRLIDYFKLERINKTIHTSIQTMPIRAVFYNRHHPKLRVIDKINGGKADSLNVGINASTKDYFCGIDSDSLLEEDALLKMISHRFDYDEETIAAGGNIVPINGCTVRHGHLEAIQLSSNGLTNFQSMEYFRAFMAGRLGWATLNCLTIISGAFGLFNRDHILRIGGYLTHQGGHQKDTVGEDMELVVRLIRYRLEHKEKYRILYSYNANCWTEVPEQLNILYSQRDRWQRGLVDVIYYHRELFFNPKYGKIGLVALPYYFIFEFLGPFIEVQGYLMVFLAAVFGLLNLNIVIALFCANILMGVMVSAISLLISTKTIFKFRLRGVFSLIAFAVIENFGFRQLMSAFRITGYFSAMKKPKGWGRMKRKGFAA